jgi:hypothetical protein
MNLTRNCHQEESRIRLACCRISCLRNRTRSIWLYPSVPYPGGNQTTNFVFPCCLRENSNNVFFFSEFG